MRSRNNRSYSSYPTFSIGRGMKYYILVLLFAVVFTQALRSPISVVFLWFVCATPVVSFFYALIGRANVGAFVLSDETTVEKLTKIRYEFRISNYAFMPLPFTEAELFLPAENGVTCESRMISMSILPRGEYYFESEVVFRYRGSYRVGVGCIYVSDMFRLFRLRRRVNIYSKIYVMPRQLLFSRGDDNSPSDTPTDSKMVGDGNVSSETNLIREYRIGDPLKHIHWKLSSKVQDIQVNDYKPNAGKNIYVFCDFATMFPPETESGSEHRRRGRKKKEKSRSRVVRVKLPSRSAETQMTADEKVDAMAAAAADRAAAVAAIAESRRETAEQIAAESEVSAAEKQHEADVHEESAFHDPFEHANDIIPEMLVDYDAYCADGVSELTVGVIMNEIGRGNTVVIMWFDERADNGFFAYEVSAYDDIESLFKHFGTAPFCDYDLKVTRLPSLIDDADSPTFVYVTAAATLDTLSEYIEASRGAGAERTEVLLFDPTERFVYPEIRREYVEMCRLRYGESKISFTAVDPSWKMTDG